MDSLFRKSELPPLGVSEQSTTNAGLEDEDLSLRQVIRILRKRKNLILGAAGACLACALLLSFVMRSYYNSSATIEIQKDQDASLGSALDTLASTVGGGSGDTKTEVQTQVAILQSDDLAIETIERTGFEKHIGSYWHLFPSGRVTSEQGLPLRNAPRQREAMLKKFGKALTVTPIPDTRLIQIAFEDPDPNFAAQVLNTLIGQYTQDVLTRRNASTTQASEWMSAQIKDLNQQVEAAQQKLINYEKESGLIAITATDPKNPAAAPVLHIPALDRLTALNQDLVTAEASRVTREALYRLARSGDLDRLTSLGAESLTSPTDQAQAAMFTNLQALRQRQSQLKQQMASAVQIYGARNPHLVDVDKQLSDVDSQIKGELKLIVDRTELDLELARQSEDALRQAYEKQEQEANKINDSQIRLAVLQQEADSTRQLYETLYGRLEVSKLDEGIKSTNVAVISAGLPPAKPSHPDPLVNGIVGLGGGLFVGLILAFVVETLDDSVATTTDAEELTGIAVLGVIPIVNENPRVLRAAGRAKANGSNGSKPGRPTAMVYEQAMATEAFRSLRTTLLLSQAGSAPKSLLLTSSLPGEGKSTTTYGLGRCFGSLGTRVLLIDADLRRPTLHKHAMKENDRGLSNLLTSVAEPSDFIQKDSSAPNLDILCAGPIPPNPAELLASNVFSDLLKRVVLEYDLVLIDSPPAMLVSDAAIISSRVDGVVLVARAGIITRAALGKAVEVLRRNKAPLRGLVLNAVNTKGTDYYYSHGYYGYDSYGSNGNA
ncbi:Protein-tyrosine kinase [Candidatus Koribacter versatilis Ellin345]|uniref:non-specific protein-tyrosine kinase n=1 Tax=Koribacter versatilis (strain Ellin345) TaxID=204669 RepID=Q1IJZ6_KORVE|nr:polysaccharide biosynthesis tyrosine autokinase [Candidatus Koribacter versatilis]ABF42804.1 Protein-tyrosine kinase [Candidatus Koribacter versatilis Ellin345]